MNPQNVKTESPRSTAPRQAATGSPAYRGRKKANASLLRALSLSMAAVMILIFIGGLLLLILPTFRVTKIEVEGNSLYTAEEIIAASGLTVGQELFSVDKAAVRENIWEWDEKQIIDTIGIGCYPGKILIRVSEKPNVMYTEFAGKYISLDRNFRVLCESTEESDFAAFLKVELPAIASAAVGKNINFRNADVSLSYITELIDGLESAGMLSKVSSLDFSQKYSVSYVMENSCRVEFGKVCDTTAKLALVEQILSAKGETMAPLSVIDVSDMQKPTYRPLSSFETLLG